MGSERNHVAAEEVKTANNLLEANLHSSNNTSINIPPCRQVEVLQLINNINEPLSFSHKLAAKFKQQRERRLARSTDDKTKMLGEELRTLIE